MTATYTSINSANACDTAPPPQVKLIEQQRFLDDSNTTVSGRALRNHTLNPYFLQKYTLGGQELGHGGFGFVVTCHEKSTGIERAVKFIIKDKLPSVNWVQCPLTGDILPLEIYALKSVQHPNIIQFLDYFDDSIYFYLVMEIHGSQWQQQQQESDSPTTTPSSSETTAFYSTTSAFFNTCQPPELSESKSTTTTASDSSSPSNSSSDNDDYDDFEDEGDDDDDMFDDGDVLYFRKTEVATSHPVPPPLPSTSIKQFVRRTSCDLFECIEQHKRFDEPLAKYIFKQVVDCVAYLNYVGLCHRDIKDENIVIDQEYKVKLIDFGSAVLLPKQYTEPRHFFTRFYGTLSFASPEILLSRPYKAEPAEIWSLGVLLFTLIFGEIPFPDSQSALEGRMIQPRSVFNSSQPLLETISLECQDLIRLLLQRDPEDRPTIQQVLQHPWLKEQ